MTQEIVFGGGCFWCTEAVMTRLKGVVSVVSGYAGGETKNPSCREIYSGTTGHAEVIKVEYAPAGIPLDVLFSVFFATHDPTTLNRQGNDIGTQYRSIILYTTGEQKAEAEIFMKKLRDDAVFGKPIVTELKPLGVFYPAEEYHQEYYDRNQGEPYCQFIIDPKISKLRQKFSHLLKDLAA